MAENKAAKKNRALKFFKETKSEMKKVTWPSKKTLFHNTVVILGFVAIATVILYVVDKLFEIGFSLLIR